jgi:hypothetical protein
MLELGEHYGLTGIVDLVQRSVLPRFYCYAFYRDLMNSHDQHSA